MDGKEKAAVAVVGALLGGLGLWGLYRLFNTAELRVYDERGVLVERYQEGPPEKG